MKKRVTAFLFACMAALMAQPYSIKGPSSPKPYEASAMTELGDYLAKRIDGTLTVGGRSAVVFHVGDTEFAKANKCFSSDFMDEQWIIKSVGNNVILNGGGTRGALYAVYHFLEDYCDIHWWNEYEDYVPKASSLTLPALDAKGRPAFLYRDIYCYHETNKEHPGYMPFAIRNRLNRAGDMHGTPEFGGIFDYGPPYHCHTFARYIPEKTYFKEHPEYFPLIGGNRIGGDIYQLCLTNLEMRQLFLEKLLKSIEKGYADASRLNIAPPRLYDVSMNDARDNFCQCPSCKAEIAQYGHSGHVLKFVNYMAENVAKRYPEIYITTLAYFACDKPPKGGVRALDNVVIKLCDTTTNQAASILEEENKGFKEFVSEWRKFAKNLFIWDYSVVYPNCLNTMLPFASEFHYSDLLKHYIANNVTGVFWEHEYAEKTDMYELKWFMEAKLMEDPHQDAEKLLELFFTRFYGAAGKYILQYRRSIDEARRKNKSVITWTAKFTSFNFIDNDLILKSEALFDQAEAAVADDPQALLHVRRARIGLDFIAVRRSIPTFTHGVVLPEMRLQMSPVDIAHRSLDAFGAWADRFPNAKNLKNSVRIWSNIDSLSHGAAPVPKELEGRNVIDFYPMHFDNQGPHSIRPDKDPESPVGDVFRIDVATNVKYKLPLEAGFYDLGNKKSLAIKYFDTIPEEPGYHWFKLPPVKLPFDGYAYFTRAWTIQLPIIYTTLQDKPVEVWFSAKFVGPQFHAGDKGADYIYVDRIVLVEAE